LTTNPLANKNGKSVYNPLAPKDNTKSTSTGTGDKSTSGVFGGSGKKESSKVGYSYIDPLTKKGFEVSEAGKKTEVTPVLTQDKLISSSRKLSKSSVNKSVMIADTSNLSDVKLNKSGSVKVGNVTYAGNAFIKELGMTANQYNREIRKRLLEQGASKKQLRPGTYSVKTQTGVEVLESGDRVIYNRYGEAVAIQSKFFGKTMSIDNYNKKVEEYNKKYEKKQLLGEPYFKEQGVSVMKKEEEKAIRTTTDKKGNKYEFYADGTVKQTDKKGREFYGEYDLKTGQMLYSGTAMAVTPEDVSTIAMGGAGLAKLGVKKGLTFAFSGLITKPVNTLYEKYTPQPQTNVGKFVKASITGLAITRSPMLGEAYLADITKALITQPRALAKSAWENKAETLGFAVGGGLLGKGFNLLELQFRGIKVEKVNLPGYGEVVVQHIPKYKDIVWVKGAFSQTEKINIMEQINRLKGDKERVFVTVSPKGVKTSVFSNTRNLGFEVTQISNPMRGLYQAPPSKFLESYKKIIDTNYGAASYYAAGSRRSILPNPLDLLRSNVKDVFSNQRPAEYIERTYKEVNTPDWIKETSQALEQGKGIPKQYQSIFNKLYKEFLDTPTKFNGKDYVGLEKEKLVNNLNLRGRGNGVKLKVYSALLEFQNKNKVRLAGGAENLSGILPYGAESQVVRALGTRFFEKSIKDLRKGVKPSVGRKLVELITGTKRGQKVAMIDGQMVEIYPVRSFDRTNLRRTKVKSAKFEQKNVPDKLVESIIGERRREGRNITPPRPFLQRTNVGRNVRTNERVNRPVNRITDLLIPRREQTRIENRPRVNVRNVPRRPEPRPRPDISRILRPMPRRPERLRRPEPRRPEPPKEQPRVLMNKKGKGKQRRGKEIKKQPDYLTMPTVFEQLSGGVRKGERAKRGITGFESSRFY